MAKYLPKRWIEHSKHRYPNLTDVLVTHTVEGTSIQRTWKWNRYVGMVREANKVREKRERRERQKKKEKEEMEDRLKKVTEKASLLPPPPGPQPTEQKKLTPEEEEQLLIAQLQQAAEESEYDAAMIQFSIQNYYTPPTEYITEEEWNDC